MSNPMAQSEPVEQRFAPAPGAGQQPSGSTAGRGSASSSQSHSHSHSHSHGGSSCSSDSATSSHGGDCGGGACSPQSTVDYDERGTLKGADVEEALKDVIDPELGINIVDLGLVYGIIINEDNHIQLNMTLTTAACPLTDVIERQTDMVLRPLSDVVTVNWVWLPAWGPERITPDGREQLRAIGFNV